MGLSINGLIALGFAVQPVGLLVGYAIRRKLFQGASNRSPFKELPRRPAGEAWRRLEQALDGKVEFHLLGLVLAPLFTVVVWLAQSVHGLADNVAFLAVYVIASGYFGAKLLKLLEERAEVQFGHEGALYVGEELSRLTGLGFEVYHDVPLAGFTMDHVLVGARGVYSVATKTRRKPAIERGGQLTTVQCSGQWLKWPRRGGERHSVDRAIEHAKALAASLGDVCGESVRVTPILTLPGWQVDRAAPPEGLQVLNPREIQAVCAAQPEHLSAAQVAAIREQLEQKCRRG